MTEEMQLLLKDEVRVCLCLANVCFWFISSLVGSRCVSNIVYSLSSHRLPADVFLFCVSLQSLP